MALKEKLAPVFYVSVAAVGLINIFYSIMELMVFLSRPNFYLKTTVTGNATSVVWSLFVNMGLLSLFILQHSVFALPGIKNFIANSGLKILERTIYVFTTAIVLQVLIRNWQYIPEPTIWKLNFSKPLWWLFITVHAIGWLLIYTGNICMDINELLGLKQVYYGIRNLPDPNTYKSRELRRLNAHMRHPSFLAFIILFWTIPVMSLDRLLLATVLSAYMYLAWNTDRVDYHYQEYQHVRKFHELENLKM